MLTSHNFTRQSSIPGSARETCRARCLCAGLMLMLMSRSPVEPQSRNLGKFLMSRSLAELQTPSSGKFRGSPELLSATVLVRFRTFWADPGHLGPDFGRLGPLLRKKQSRRHPDFTSRSLFPGLAHEVLQVEPQNSEFGKILGSLGVVRGDHLGQSSASWGLFWSSGPHLRQFGVPCPQKITWAPGPSRAPARLHEPILASGITS